MITAHLDPSLEARLNEVMGTRDLHPVERAKVQDAVLAGAVTWDDLPADVREIIEAGERLPRQAWDDPADVPDDLDQLEAGEPVEVVSEDGEPPIDPEIQAAVIARLGIDLDADDDEDEYTRIMAAAIDGDEFQAYWTRGKGLARWAGGLHPWTTLVRLLRKHKKIRDPKALAAHYFHVVFGFWPGHRKGENPVGPG